MRVAFALFIGFLTLVVGCSPPIGSPTRMGVKKKLSPALGATIHKLPPSGLTRAPLSSLQAVQEPRAATQAGKELLAYYQDQKKEPAWRDAVHRLSAADSTQRAEAASYLRDLLDQALKDELTGVGPLLPSPAWGVGATSQTRGLREWLAATLAETQRTSAALPVVRWFLDHEKLTRLQGQVLKAVTGLQGPEADALFLELATQPHPNAEVALTALTQVGERKLKVTAEPLAPLCQHYRSKLREAALALNAQLGFPAPPPFDAGRAIQSEPLRHLMDQVGYLLAESAPADAPFVCLTTRYARNQTTTVRGWLLSEDPQKWTLLPLNGLRSSFSKKAEHDASVMLTSVALKDEVDRLAALRSRGNLVMEMSARGGLSGECLGGLGIGYEAVLAQWLYSSQRYELAAAVLLPALDTLLLDSHLVEMTRDWLGNWYGTDMLAAFVGDRGYAKTAQLAKRLAERFAGSPFYPYAVRLLDELPRRCEDFKTFRLPTPQEWAVQKQQLSRREQIDFLCRRLRLLNCFQMGQPGGPMYDETQYAEPCGISPDAAWGRRQGKTEVINPLVELIGPLLDRRQQAAPSVGLDLTVADIPILAAHLREDWFFPTVSFWRNFRPGRNLHRTRPLIASLINRLAWRTLCDADKLEAMTDKQREEEIARLTKWAEENRDKDEETLLLGALEDAVKARKPLLQQQTSCLRLAQLKTKAAIPLLFQFALTGPMDPVSFREIRRWCNQIDPGALEVLAHKALKHEDENVRIRAAALAITTTDRAEALAVLSYRLASGKVLLAEMISTVLDDKAPDCCTTAARVFQNPNLLTLDARARSTIIRQTASAGLADGLHLYLRLLETPGNTIAGKTYDRPVAELAAEELCSLMPLQPVHELQGIRKKPASPQEKITALKTWLKGRIAKLEGQK